MTQISPTKWARWRRNPCDFVEEVLHDPETGKPFRLLDVERAFMERAFETDADGHMLYPELVYGAPKKSGKTAFGALFMLTMVILYGGRFSEGYAAANDQEQAQGRVFQAARRIVETSPLLAERAEITKDKIIFASFSGASITAIANDYAGAAGSNPTITVFDEAWAYTSERSRRLFDESVPPPTRLMACRLIVTYAGFEGESTMLEELYKRGLQQPEIGPGLYAGDGILMSWQHGRIAPWQTESWLEQMRRSLRANQFLRMIENRFVTSESSFVDIDSWDACVDQQATPIVNDPALPIFVGVDASHKHDSTALVAVTWDQAAQKVRLIAHRVFQPSPDDPLNFEDTIEATLLDWSRRFQIRKVFCDPWQLQAVMQRLLRNGIPIEEYPQTQSNLTDIGQNLFELVQGRNLVLYPDAGMRLAVSRAVAVETPRGWRISKEKQSHKIDVVIALAMACHAAVSRGEAGKITWAIVAAPWCGSTGSGSGRSFEDYMADAKAREAQGVPSPHEDHETYQRAMEMRAGVRINGEPLPWPEIMNRIKAEQELLK
jgi:phage terminase large subunit-like protein